MPLTRRGRSGWPLAAVTVVVLLALAVAAYAVTRPAAEPARRALRVSSPVAASIRERVSTTVHQAEEAVPKPAPPKPAAVASRTPAVSKPKAAPKPVPPAPFDVNRAMAHTRELSVSIGKRVGGTVGEAAAIAYARDYFFKLGYAVTVQPVALSNGRTSHNVVASRVAALGKPIVVVGGHIDSKGVAPGADDNATGCGTVLELARDFAKATPTADYRFVLFGTEELIGDGDGDHHHFGSREYVRRLTSTERSRLAAAVIIDMIGYGPDFRVRTMGIGTRALSDRLLATARITGAPLEYLQDPGKPSGWSDHEPFERAGFPAAWLEWRDNPNAHTTGDTYAKLNAGKVKTTGVLVHTWLRSVKLADLQALARL